MIFLPYPAPLEKAHFKKRYKRFFVDVEKEDGTIEVVHCANTGSLKSCLVENAPAYILKSNNPERKLKYTLELLSLQDGLACVNTGRANEYVYALFTDISSGELGALRKHFSSYTEVKREAVYDKATRFDFCLSNSSGKKCWIEVKSVSLQLDEKTWAFPDAVTERGQKHISTLMDAVEQGDEAWMFYVMMRGSLIDPKKLAHSFRTAHEIDSKYAELFNEAKKKGVRVGVVVPDISPKGFGFRYFQEI